MSEVHPALAEAQAEAHSADGLAATIASRICHDLVSPIGAIANGVELLLLAGAERTPEMELIAESVESANARMRFFRLAFGTASLQAIGRSEVVTTLRGLERGSRLSFDWTPPGDHPRTEIKAVFLLIQCLETAMPMGGKVRVARSGDLWNVSAEGPRLRINQLAWEALGSDGANAPSTAAMVQFALLPPLLASLDRRIHIDFAPDSIMARF